MTVYDRSDGFSSDVLLLKDVASSLRATEIENLYICQYDNRRPYLLAHLASDLRIRNLYLPVPQNERERAIAKRLEQEAKLHQIRVDYEDVTTDKNT